MSKLIMLVAVLSSNDSLPTAAVLERDMAAVYETWRELRRHGIADQILDTITVGALTMIVGSDLRDRIEPGFRQIAGEWAEFWRTDPPPVLILATPFILNSREKAVSFAARQVNGKDADLHYSFRVTFSKRWSWGSKTDLVRRELWRSLSPVAIENADATVQDWVDGYWFWLALPDLYDNEEIAREMVVRTALPDVKACSTAGQRCREALIGGHGYSPRIRSALLANALAVAGPGSWRRVAATGTSIDDRFKVLTGQDAEHNFRKWVAERPRRAGLFDGVGVVSALLWLGLATGLALRGKTR